MNIRFAHRHRYYEALDAYHGEEHSAGALVELIVRYELAELEKRIRILRGGR